MAVKKKSKKNLKPFKKGDSRAIEAGKKSKRGISIVTALKKQFLSGEIDIDKIAKEMIEQMPKNPAMAKLIIEQLDGKPLDKIEITGAKENYIIVTPQENAMMKNK